MVNSISNVFLRAIFSSPVAPSGKTITYSTKTGILEANINRKVNPLFKKVSKDESTTARLIPPLHALNKSVERVIFNEVCIFLEEISFSDSVIISQNCNDNEFAELTEQIR